MLLLLGTDGIAGNRPVEEGASLVGVDVLHVGQHEHTAHSEKPNHWPIAKVVLMIQVSVADGWLC